ncbi:MAG: ABC transporter permease [Chloroflexi bacterium HGW-Chloroflexi-10]|nr:MAG: ABC transporter permease [Chloroflexi bacterium HGW-Chloroflexi-10]
MIQLYKMAFRDLGRNRRRSFFSALALAIGLALLLFMASIISGEMRDSVDLSVKLQSGHLQVRNAEYDENKTSLAWNVLIENPEALAQQISSLEPIKFVTPRLYASGIVISGDNSLGVRVMGVDVTSAANEPYLEGMVSGAFLSADDREGILIGESLAKKLHLASGDTVQVMVNTSNGEVDEQRFFVRGTYATKSSSLDESLVLMPLAKAQAITQTDGYASVLFIMLHDSEQVNAVKAAIQTTAYTVVSWEDLNVLLAQIQSLYNVVIYFIYLIVLGITATVIINTLIMSVYERTREIGILSAIGMKSGRIMAMFFAESSLIALGGVIMGMLLGGIAVAYATVKGFYIGNMGVSGLVMGDRIYAYLTIQDAVTLTILSFIVTLLAALYPALIAARMQPVDALRGGK